MHARTTKPPPFQTLDWITYFFGQSGYNTAAGHDAAQHSKYLELLGECSALQIQRILQDQGACLYCSKNGLECDVLDQTKAAHPYANYIIPADLAAIEKIQLFGTLV